ncbi:hypothetical protein [Pseudomonas glycinae]|uniref:Uncharacterized protein n=1 Tax=Pseudomonas glycinae TaxID=1785145 RepID=A0ABM5ZJT0_9PSED|nr:hypothetical protein [Pseudomonas glycinae]AMQ83915.1 hypothetical protein AWU82_11530 [Pseudomonas glycinae]
MKSSDGRWDYYLVYILAFFTVSLVMGFLVAIGAKPLEAWFQGVATVAAMLVGIATLGVQRKHALQAEKEKDRVQRQDARNAVIALKDHQLKLFNRVTKLGVLAPTRRVLTKASTPEDPHLFNELQSSAVMLRDLPLTSMHIEMIHYVINLRENSVVGAAWEKSIQEDFTRISTVKREASIFVAELEKWDEEIYGL